MTATEIAGIITTAVTTLTGVLVVVAPIVAALGASIIGLMFGWKLFKRFTH